MNSSDLINENLIDLEVEARTKEEVLEVVSRIAYEEGRVQDKDSYLRGLIERERDSTTGFGDGIAIPHAKIEQVMKPTITVIKLKDPVDWNALDNKPVQLIIALAVPLSQEGKLHLQLLARLSGELMEEDFKEALVSANTKEEIYNTITSVF